jgi:hypothetical protein
MFLKINWKSVLSSIVGSVVKCHQGQYQGGTVIARHERAEWTLQVRERLKPNRPITIKEGVLSLEFQE